MAFELKDTEKKDRPKAARGDRPTQRIPMGTTHRDILTVQGMDSAFQYRWFSDTNEGGGRVQRAKLGGWELALAEDHKVGTAMVFKSTDVGSIVRIPADKEGNYLYLMRIQKEWYEEDQRAKRDSITEQERAMATPAGHEGLNREKDSYGEVKIGRS